MRSSADAPFRFASCGAYLFDIDGTLLNCRDGVHYNAFHAALRQVYGVELKIDAVPVHGSTDRSILRAVAQQAGVSATEFERHLPRALAVMRKEVECNAIELRPEVSAGARELLELLAAAGATLAVFSGALEAIGWRKLEACRLRGYFIGGSFGDELESRDEIVQGAVGLVNAVRPGQRICLVGDTPADIAAARAAGVPVAAVASGIYSTQQLSACRPDLCVADCGELTQRVDVLAGKAS